MKRIFIALLLVLFLCTGAWAGDWMKQSAQLDDDSAITTSGGVFHRVIIISDSSDYIDIDIYDNATAASGTKLIPTTRITTSSTDRIQSISLDPPVRYYNGIYVDITTNGTAKYMVYYFSD